MKFLINTSPISCIDISEDLSKLKITLDCIPPAALGHGLVPPADEGANFRQVSRAEFITTSNLVENTMRFGDAYPGMRYYLSSNAGCISIGTIPNLHKKLRDLEAYLRPAYVGLQQLIDEGFNSEIDYHINKLKDAGIINDEHYTQLSDFIAGRLQEMFPEDYIAPMTYVLK